VILRKLQGLSQQDIATQLGISVNTVEVQLVRGMKRCDDYLKERGIDRSRPS
jgi:DNA-directed RNA polymerase specialized sigma24 family protein